MYTKKEVLRFVKENDVKFVRLTFCNPFGEQKNISLLPDGLADAFEKGVSFDGSAILGFSDVTKSDLFLFPDPATLTILPWRPSPGRVVRFYCDIKNPDGSNFWGDTRYLLKQVLAKGEEQGYACRVGTECEFYLFKTDENGEPTQAVLDHGGYLDIAPLDNGENIRREICLCLEEMGLMPETSHHQQGPGQNEICFKYSGALSSADHLLTFKSVVKSIASRNGLYASFMPKPLAHERGSALHVNLSIVKNDTSLSAPDDGEQRLDQISEHFLAGILDKVPEMTLFLNPLTNSYERFASGEAPKSVSWSYQNRSQLIRIPAANSDRYRMELRSPDPTLNPYLAFALLISAGYEGIQKSMALPPPQDIDMFRAEASVLNRLQSLPESLLQALESAEQSAFIAQSIPAELRQKYFAIKQGEALAFQRNAERREDKESFYHAWYFSKS
ncbi:MAG: glutamine synthetase family protein [Peptococcaceae bacterium]|jgi:glutamine synthetase|nr:glutamine synthetase family protein [Peptococcaceae bacterium]